MWRSPTTTSLIGPNPPFSRIVHVMPRVIPNATVNDASMLNSAFSRVRRDAVALAQRHHGLDRLGAPLVLGVDLA